MYSLRLHFVCESWIHREYYIGSCYISMIYIYIYVYMYMYIRICSNSLNILSMSPPPMRILDTQGVLYRKLLHIHDLYIYIYICRCIYVYEYKDMQQLPIYTPYVSTSYANPEHTESTYRKSPHIQDLYKIPVVSRRCLHPHIHIHIYVQQLLIIKKNPSSPTCVAPLIMGPIGQIRMSVRTLMYIYKYMCSSNS